jgi:signal transduction histidine kinase
VTNCIEISRRYLSFLRESPAEQARVQVNQILTDLGELLKVHPSAKGHQLIVQTLPADAVVQINGTDLIQILLNLALNALQCSPNPHRVEIRGEVLSEPLDMSRFVDGPQEVFANREGLNQEGQLVALYVEDNGPGILPDVLPKIFSAYFSTKKEEKAAGTGLGLSIVQRLLREARGAVNVRTRVGGGTLFTVYLPSPDESPASPVSN